ncbi:MAG: EAL domain-containing protein [Anaerovoracaceae bacterium]
MQLIYNYDFVLAAMVFLGIIIFHFISDRKMNVHKNRVFLVYMILGISDMALDVISSVFISRHSPELYSCVMITCTLYYLLQVIVPTSMFYYVATVRKEQPLNFRQFLGIVGVPFTAVVLLIVSNYWNGKVFYTDSSGGYHHGSLYLWVYLYALLCMGMILAAVLWHGSRYTFRQRVILLEVVAIAAGCMGLQIYLDKVLLTGFAIGLVIMILLFSFHNPYSYTDNLTGVYDFDFFQEFLSYAREKKRCYHMVSCNICNLNYLNSALEPEAVRGILRSTAGAIREITGSDLIFRIDSSQFLVLVSKKENTYETAKKLDAILKEKNDARPVSLRAQYNMICMDCVTEAENTESLLDFLNYMGKKACSGSGNRLLQGSRESLEEFRCRNKISEYLSVALDRDLFEVWFQPVYSLEKECFVSMEALSRLHHPELGSVSAELFIQLAEQSGQISRLGILQFKKVCRFVRENRQHLKSICNIKINLSPAEFMTPGHVETLLSIMDEYGIEPSFFQFEITETVATVYSDYVLKTVEELEKRGISLCLDDFGSGYANLSSVMGLPFRTVKLDKTLLQGAEHSTRVRKFYRSIVHILLDMGYRVVAEGVETEEELAFVRECRVNCVQGYYYAKPLSMEHAAEFFKSC